MAHCTGTGSGNRDLEQRAMAPGARDQEQWRTWLWRLCRVGACRWREEGGGRREEGPAAYLALAAGGSGRDGVWRLGAMSSGSWAQVAGRDGVERLGAGPLRPTNGMRIERP